MSNPTVDSNPSALIVIDVQNALTEGLYGDPRPHNRDEMLGNIRTLLGKAREAGAQVIYVQHREDQYEAMSPGHHGFAIESSIAPEPGDPVFQKTVGDSFSNPELAPLLRNGGVVNVAVCGMQSDMCVQASTRGAIANGFNVTLITDAHATYDTDDKTAVEIMAEINQTLAEVSGEGTAVTPLPTAAVTFAGTR
ncbi:MAG TPA: isochorismatase family protein [Thermomicrobiales bacterium]|nr:isochorismatase family protein [Thermomicrobiales bacterium]